jgi:hypothetical protein
MQLPPLFFIISQDILPTFLPPTVLVGSLPMPLSQLVALASMTMPPAQLPPLSSHTHA